MPSADKLGVPKWTAWLAFMPPVLGGLRNDQSANWSLSARPEANSERFEGVKAKLDELRSYLYAKRESVRGYPKRT